MDFELFWGVDYGAQASGTTVIVYYHKDLQQLICERCEKGSNADEWLLEVALKGRPASIFLDAPLSLPRVYSTHVGNPQEDYFYRKADRQLNAMSPMFLGGLTARAIRLACLLRQADICVMECYPRGVVNLFEELKVHYSKKSVNDIHPFLKQLQGLMAMPFDPVSFKSWHDVDALLAWFIGKRYLENKANIYGVSEEGIIVI